MKKRLMAMVLSVLMVVSVIPMSVIPVSAVTVSARPTTPVLQNTNQGDGIILAKYAQTHLENGVPDGTVDIVIQAHTTGQVTRTDTVVPTDIALVLDLSGSMDEIQGRVTRTDYTAAYATETRYGAYRVYYTMNTTGDMYIKTAADTYTRVRSAGFDDNGYQYYYYGGYNNRTYVYPELEAGLAPSSSRSENYDVEQFYAQTTVVVDEGAPKIDLLKEAVDVFIAGTAEHNATITDEADMHRISIIKFGTADYYNDNDLLAEGDNKNYQDYNYCQVVKDFTTVDADGKTELINAMDALEAGGATAVDYGMYLADLLFAKHETTEAAQGRNKVVIVLTDGAPTHSSSYQSSVAGAAINYAKVLKGENVKVYTISVEDGADGTELGSSDSNRFMHYLSSNYPSASYDDDSGVITAGTGSPANGYYLTPDTTYSLSMIFEKINQEIGEPSITLGEEATLVDAVSEFFTIPTTGANRVTVATADRLEGGVWDTAKPSGLTPTISGNTVTVEGFDFDENYVSNEPRTVNGEDFWGRMLILTINVTPDYAAIDAHADEIAANGGAIETNYGAAEVMSGTNVVASVASPTIALNTITYEVDGDEYATYYRLPGGEHTLIAAPTKTGYTFSGWSTDDATVANGAFTMPEADVTVVGEFTANTHDVTYQFVGLQVYDETILDDMAQKDVPYGSTVTVEYPDELEIDGYTFVGWYPQDEELGTSNLTEFSMPDHDVVLLGRYVPGTSTAYKVEHYTENLDGTFKLEVNDTENLSGTTGADVTAVPNDYEGFTYDASYDDGNGNKTVASGTIAADGSLVLTLYYTRNKYSLTYEYVGTVPPNAAPTATRLDEYFETYKYGETVTVNPDATAAGYIFTGWYSLGGTVTNDTASFTMPAHDVTLHGYFSARTDLEYQVEHYFENANNNRYTLDPTKTETFHNATVGQVVEALPLNVQGYIFNPNNVNQYLEETITGNGVVVLEVYYERVRYTVTYDYEGFVPDDANPAQSALTSTQYKWGEIVPAPTVAPTASGYEFHGWYFNGSRDIITASFEMPAHDVLILGHFDPTTGLEYYVEHYFENANGTYDHNSQYDETFKGDKDQTVTATPVDVAGYVYNANASTATGIVPNAESEPLTLKLYYDYAPYTVTYSYEGFVPVGASGLPATETHDYKSNVTVAAGATAPGYTFKGWYRNNDATKTEITSLEMPHYNVELAGRFVANTDTPYTVEHYLETAVDGVYETTPYKTENLTGTTGVEVTATPIGIDHYTYNPSAAGTKRTGVIVADDPGTADDETLILKLYYDRNTYTVTYVYTGLDPEGIVIPAPLTNVMYGATVTIADKLDDYDGFAFNGWHSNEVNVTGGATTFTMPAKDVVLYGQHDGVYDVRYYVDDKLYETYTVIPGAVHDIIDDPDVSGFLGWDDPINVKKDAAFIAVDDNFIMPWSDVEIYGETREIVIPVIPRGTLTISKAVVAPEDANAPAEYTFDIFKVNGDQFTLRETLVIKAGESASVKLSSGEYKVVERRAEIDGYNLNVTSTDEDGIVTVSKDKETVIEFTNTYTEMMLETDDHFGYIIGYPDGTVRPEADITRAEVVTIFFRMFTDGARDRYWAQTNKFTDVAEDAWYNTAISTLANAGVLDGYTDGTFKPNDTITRAELIKIATSFYETTAGKSSEFSDIEAHWAEKFIDEAYKLGIVDGYGDGTFHPDQAVTRAEAMKIVNRTLERAPHKDHLLDSMIKWPDNADTEKWYYAEVQEATNSHDYDMEGGYERWTALRPIRDWAALELTWKEEHEGN